MDASPDNTRFMDYLLYRSHKEEGTAEEEAKVREWRSASAANEAHYRELGRLLELTADAYRLPEHAVGPPPDIERLVRLTRPVGAGATPAPDADPTADRPARRRLWLWGGLGGAAAAAVTATVLFLASLPAPAPRDLLSFGVDEFATGPTDVATVQLQDGTIVRLGPESRLRLTGSAGEREVTLDGRAYFAVAELDGHPFRVRTRGGDAVVLGTRFEAEARGDELRLLVVEGRVALAAAGSRIELGAGEMARAYEGAVSAAVAIPDAEHRLAWTGNFLVFQRTPVEEVVSEVRRRFTIEVDVIGPNLAEQTVTAWFADASAEDVLRVVCKVLAATCTTRSASTTIDLTPNPR